MTEEPHRSRRKAIMKAHPEVSIRLLPLVSFFSVVSRHGWTFRTCQTTHKPEFELFSSTCLFARNSSPDRCGLIDT